MVLEEEVARPCVALLCERLWLVVTEVEVAEVEVAEAEVAEVWVVSLWLSLWL